MQKWIDCIKKYTYDSVKKASTILSPSGFIANSGMRKKSSRSR